MAWKWSLEASKSEPFPIHFYLLSWKDGLEMASKWVGNAKWLGNGKNELRKGNGLEMGNGKK